MAYSSNVDFGLPADPDLQEIQRRKAYADLLRQQSSSMPQGQMAGNIYVAPSWTQYAAQALKGIMANRAESEIPGLATEYQHKRQKAIAEALGKTDPKEQPSALMGIPGFEDEAVKMMLDERQRQTMIDALKGLPMDPYAQTMASLGDVPGAVKYMGERADKDRDYSFKVEGRNYERDRNANKDRQDAEQFYRENGVFPSWYQPQTNQPAAQPSGGAEEFFSANLPHAQAAAEQIFAQTGKRIDPLAILAQSALETGYGASAPGNNMFGIKGPGQVQPTKEFQDGQMVATNDSFRAYQDPSQSFGDWAGLVTNDRYSPALEQAAKDPRSMGGALKERGYATDPNYGPKFAGVYDNLSAIRAMKEKRVQEIQSTPDNVIPPKLKQELTRDAEKEAAAAELKEITGQREAAVKEREAAAKELEAKTKQETAQAEKKALDDKARDRRNNYINQASNVIGTIDEADGLVSKWSAGWGGKLQNVPGTDALNLAAKLKTIKANIGFDRLQQMREASPTGGALGQVAVQELENLQATIASLDQLQDPQQLKDALGKIKMHYNNWLKTLAPGSDVGPKASAKSSVRKFNLETGKIE